MTSIGVPARDRGSRINTSTVIIAVQSLSTLTTTGFRDIYSIAAIIWNDGELETFAYTSIVFIVVSRSADHIVYLSIQYYVVQTWIYYWSTWDRRQTSLRPSATGICPASCRRQMHALCQFCLPFCNRNTQKRRRRRRRRRRRWWL